MFILKRLMRQLPLERKKLHRLRDTRWWSCDYREELSGCIKNEQDIDEG